MREMKDTASWEGRTPFAWKKNKIKYVAPIVNERSASNEGYVGLENIESWTGRLMETSLDPTGESIAFKKDDVMFGKLRPYLGKSFVAEKDGCGSTELLVMRPAKVDSHYLGYIFRSEPLIDRIDVSTYGAKMPRANGQFIGNIEISLPDSSEQQSIVSYLDQKCAAIDEAIARRRQIIEKLEEYRKIVTTALISGCDSKPVRLKFLLIKGRSGMKVGPFGSDLSTKEYVDEGPWVYTQRTVLDNNYKTNEIHVSEQKYEAMKGFEVLPGDILVTTRGTLGYVSVVPPGAPTGILHPCLIRFRIDSSLVSPTFIKCLFNETDLIMNQIKGKAEGATIGALYSGMLKDLVMPIPSLKDQEIIMQKVQNVHGRIDKQVSINTEIIERLEEYRKSIIYNAVTGKIDCREVV